MVVFKKPCQPNALESALWFQLPSQNTKISNPVKTAPITNTTLAMVLRTLAVVLAAFSASGGVQSTIRSPSRNFLMSRFVGSPSRLGSRYSFKKGIRAGHYRDLRREARSLVA